MIDVLIDAEGHMTVAHDTHSLPRLKRLCLNGSTGELAYVTDADELGIIGSMLPVMVEAARAMTRSMVVPLTGFQPEDSYECELLIS